MHYVIFSKGCAPYIDSLVPDAAGVRALPLRLDEKSEKTLGHLTELVSFDVSHMLAAVFTAGVRAGNRRLDADEPAIAGAPHTRPI